MLRFLAWLVLGSVVGCASDGPGLAFSELPKEEPPPGVGPPDDLDGFIEWQMAETGIAGVAAAVVDADGVVWTGTYGFADVERERPVDEDTLFALASISKPVATISVLQLVDDGTIDLDAPADDHLTFALRHPDYAGEPVTMRQLLTHTSGLVDDFAALTDATFVGDPTMTLGEFAEAYTTDGGSLYRATNWGPQPGTEYEYCNAAFGVLGYVAEAAGGEDLAARNTRDVLDALGMNDSGWYLADLDADVLATPYTWNRASGFTALDQNGYANYPASSLRSSVRELGLFLRMLIRGGELDGVRVLSAESAAAMETVQDEDVDSRQAITLRYQTINGRRYLGHTGSTFGGSTIMMYDPETETGFLVLTNSDAYLLGRLGIPGARDGIDAIVDRIEADYLGG